MIPSVQRRPPGAEDTSPATGCVGMAALIVRQAVAVVGRQEVSFKKRRSRMGGMQYVHCAIPCAEPRALVELRTLKLPAKAS